MYSKTKLKSWRKFPNGRDSSQSCLLSPNHYDDVLIDAISSLITSLTIVYSTNYSDADQRKHQSSTSLTFVWGIHRGPVNSPHKWSVTRKMFPFDHVIMYNFMLTAAMLTQWVIRLNSFGTQELLKYGKPIRNQNFRKIYIRQLTNL